MRRAGTLLHDRRGVSAVEFALIAPVFIMMIVGLAQVGRLFFADADLRNALSTGARQATIFPMPTDDEILDAVEAQLTGLNPDLLVNEISHHVDSDGRNYSDLRVGYAISLDFLFFETAPIMLTAERRVYTHDPDAQMTDDPSSASSTSAGGTTSSTGGSTTSAGGTSTTSGGTTTTSGGTTSSGDASTTSGGTTTTSGGTTTTSGGTTTTSGGTTTTSGGTTTSSGGTTTSSGNGNGNGSSGGDNGNGGGRGNGTCRRC